MIERISVRGVGGITSAQLDLDGSFIAITGESGSGKSSLVRAFEFVTGRRATASMIKTGADEAEVEALWSTDGDDVVTSRSAGRSGRPKCAIDGSMASVSMLADFSKPHIQIQSQFAQLDLLDADRQLELVDQCGGDRLEAVKLRLAKTFPAMLASERELVDLRRRRESLAASLDGAGDRVRKIKSLSLYEGCDDEWNADLADAERAIVEAGRYEEISEMMRCDDGEDIADKVALIVKKLYAAAPDGEAEEWSRLGEAALSNMQSLFEKARRALSLASIETLEERRDAAEARLGSLRKLLRETGLRRANDLIGYVAEVERDMKWLEESASLVAKKSEDAASLRTEAASLARELRSLRVEAAKTFAERVNVHLADLAMGETRFDVEITKHDRLRANGAEGASFTLSAGGRSPLPVAKAASGGELSRILIAIQSSIESDRLPGTIVFDEVEAGLGGRAALLAGSKLRELSTRCRVILITHEATIAAMAERHFLVGRIGDETMVDQVEGEARTAEIARMLSGAATDEALDHARALIKKYKKE